MYYLMLIYTFLLSLKTSWTYNNFTYLSYQKDLRIHYLLWIMIISCFLLYKINKLFKSNDFIYKKKFKIKTKDYEREYTIISKSYDYLLCIDGTKIYIKDIIDIK